MSKRQSYSKEIEAKLLVESKHTCNICRKNNDVQIHHINEDSSDSSEDNLIVVCLNCHSAVHTKRSLAKNYSPETLRLYKKTWTDLVRKSPLEDDYIKENLTPVLIKNNKKTQLLDNKQKSLFIQTLPKIKSRIYNFLTSDQINETGAWGVSLMNVMQNISEKPLPDLDKKEGGILNTYLALRGLLKYENSSMEFRLKNYSKLAQKYLLERQNHAGGFGRYIFSKSGLEIHSSLRHTALAVSALIDLEGPPVAIYKGLLYISKHWNIEDVRCDACPAMAIASTIHVINKFLDSNYLSQFTKKDIEKLNIPEWNDVYIMLLSELKNQSSSSNFKPFWEPYGENKIFIFATALTTIDLLSTQMNNSLNSVTVDILYSILGKMNDDGGIPYSLDLEESDFGITLYFYAIIANNILISSTENEKIREKFDNAKTNLENYLVNNFEHFEKSTYTHGDNLAPIFFVN